MKATKAREYRSKREDTKGQKRYSYGISGTPEELAQFKKQQGQFYVETNEGVPLWNRTEDYGKKPEVAITQDGRFVMVLDELAVAYEKAERFPLFAKELFAEAKEREQNGGQRARVTATVKAEAPANLED